MNQKGRRLGHKCLYRKIQSTTEAADLRRRKKVMNEGVTGFSLKVKRLGRTGGKEGKETKIAPFCLSFFLKRRRGRESWRAVYDGAFSFLLKCKQLYMMAMAPEGRGRISATMAASDFYIFYNYTTRLCCHVSNYQKYTFDRIS